MKNNKIYLLLLFIVVGLFYGCPSTYEYKPSPFIISLWYDAGANELYVLKGNNILVFNDASTANGHVTPARIISLQIKPPSTSYWGLWNLWLDKASNQLFIASQYTNEIYVFTNASTINGNIIPARVISGTSINGPKDLWLDSNSDQLYVGESNNSILVFTSASTMSGDVTPARVISGAATELNYPTSLWLDSNSDQLYVASGYSNTSILVFTQASTANGNVAPARSISSTDFYGLPCWIWLDSLSNQLYVTSGYVSAGVFVITDATIANGNVVPTRKITATQVLGGLGGPFWVDSTSDQLYITHQGIKEPGSILVFDNASTINGDVTPSRVIYP
ncbi:MAG: hypothetical protein M1381_03045 [Deltaproteobacteria bacterium]|nr:hypothetical protein [Deltaproteobacteria bacterium]MCL5791941.1 hypothetical protein [Deltaproteobacteria bacterium]